MFNPVKEINSRWETEKGGWNGTKYTSRHKDIAFHILTMEIKRQEGRELLHFHSGPTGFETYILADLTLEGEGDFCICGGTINRWPACYVDVQIVKEFIDAYKASKIEII